MQNSLLKKLCTQLLETSVFAGNGCHVQDLLNQLNCFNYRIKWPFLNRWTCTDVLMHLIGIVTANPPEGIDVGSVLQLVINLAAKQELVVSNLSVDVMLHGLKDLWFQTVKLPNHGDGLLCSFIGAISAVCYGNGAYILSDTLDWIISDREDGIKRRVLKQPRPSLNVQKTYMQCLSGLCMASESRECMSDEYLFQCLQIFTAVLQSAQHTNDVSSCRVIFAAHKGISNLLESSHTAHVKYIGPLLGALKRHCVFGLAAFARTTPSELDPIPMPDSVITQQTITSNPSKKKKKKSKHVKKNTGSAVTDDTFHDSDKGTLMNGAESSSSYSEREQSSLNHSTILDISIRGMLATSSESDYSDSEAGQRHKLSAFALKIRQMALANLGLVVRNTNKHVMFGFWNYFIPDNDSTPSQQVSLLYCIANDPAPKARVAALLVLSSMLQSSKNFLALISAESVSSSFVSFSGIIASSIHVVHKHLLSCLEKEVSSVTQVHLLKCLAALAYNAPYTKLNSGLITSVVNQVRRFLSSSHSTDCQIAALSIFMSLFERDPALEEVVEAVTRTTTGFAITKPHISLPLSESPVAANAQSWLVQHCLELLDFDKVEITLTLRVASLQTLSVATKSYFIVLKYYVTQLKNIVIACIRSGNSSIRLHACKLLEELGRSLLHGQVFSLESNLTLWVDILSGSVQQLCQGQEDPVVRGRLCDCLSTIGSGVFEKLPEKLQIYCQTLLLGLSADENYLVRSGAVRCLAVYVMYPVLRKDIGFMLDVASCIVKLMDDDVKSVQCNAAWSFANLTDALVVNADSDASIRSQLRDSFVIELFQFGIKVFNNKDKVRFNMMRVIGNLLRFCDGRHLQNETLQRLMLQSIDLVVRALMKDPLMKVRWNACLACANFLDNDKLPIGTPEWTDEVYKALSATVTTSKNYKVRIKASAALICPKTRAHYGSLFSEVFSCIAAAVKNTLSDTVDLAEFKFRDRLQEQLCCTVIHLIKLMDLNDFAAIMVNISHASVLHEQLEKYYTVLLNRDSASKGEVACQEEGYMTVGTLADDVKLRVLKQAAKHWERLASESNTPRTDIKCLFSFLS